MTSDYKTFGTLFKSGQSEQGAASGRNVIGSYGEN